MKRCISAKFSFESGADQPLKIKLLFKRLLYINSLNLRTETRNKKGLGPLLFRHNRQRSTITNPNERLSALINGGGRWSNFGGLLFMK
jgi:hypothetical protein